jgi:uncharacterized coiled-coil protein SlyX
MTADESTPDRLTAIEMLLSHLQHDIDKLHEALISQQSQIDGLRRLLARWEASLEELPLPPTDPAADRPPHY